ncbi:hypothetical protein HUJ04_005637 [Dendroctonus ponderosae]|uniref:ALMS motif domain-containing protein n=1 Tax=Dendroctonus ponderosae TaxID=77166 RepID=A0AAR5Q1S6_DENPD|nr:hypothetical protein HUJ04_005637 [Dendroctonus ponderosae]
MSINVTVTGNPVSIRRGQMITNPQREKEERDKRRILRLQQVRQQSKDLAAKVRNKVRTEQKKHQQDIERDGREKLKDWQNRQLLELHNQYLDALDEIGVGHKEAEELADESALLESEKLRNEEIAKTRGKLAQTKHQIQKNEDNYKKAVPIQQKKLVRDIENTRAALVSALPKKAPKPKTKQAQTKVTKNATTTDINITIPNEDGFSEIYQSDSSSKQSESPCECSETSEDHSQTINLKMKPPSQHSSEKSAPKPKSYQETLDERKRLIDEFRAQPKSIPIDTRISDRIKQRQFKSTEPDYCDSLHVESLAGHFVKLQSSCRLDKDPLELSSDDCICTKINSSCPCKTSKSTAVQTEGKFICKCEKSRHSSRKLQSRSEATSGRNPEIPVKPAVKLKATSEEPVAASTVSSAYDRVPHYDFPNRFVTERQSSTQVEKVDGSSLEVVPNVTSEVEWQEIIKQRDVDAHVRGKRALEKEKAQRDYQELMKKLPVLQRKEHIAQIGTDKPEYHMSEERLKEREKQRQNRLENAYSQAIPNLKPQIVTLPKRKLEINKPDEPFEILNGDDSRTLNLGKWDTDSNRKTMFSAEEVHEIIRAFTVQKPEDRKAKLKQLLNSLKLQKEQLINEIRALPKDDSIDALIMDLTSFSDDDKPLRPVKRKSSEKVRKRRLEETESQSDTSSDVKVRERHHKHPKGHHTDKCGHHKDKYGRSPKKRMKKPSRVLVLQNMSTQTTPKSTKEQASTTTTTTGSSNEQLLPNSVKICTKSHTPCDCYKSQNGDSSEEVCKIFIKINEENPPKIQVVQTATVEPEKAAKDKEASPRKSSNHSGKENKPPKSKTKVTEVNLPASKDSKAPHRGTRQTWKEQLSKNSMSTSSTSYMSPPDFSRPNTTTSTEASRQSLYNLRRKPQPTEVAIGSMNSKVSSQSSAKPEQMSKTHLVNYIKRLLSMSKASVDDLGVSSSDVQTPSQSIIEMEPNNPLASLHNAVRLINLRAADFPRDSGEFFSTKNSSQNSQTRDHSSQKNDSSTEKIAKEHLLSQYADVTDSCTKRIANLAAMIEQLRQEKLQMMESPPLVPYHASPSSPQPEDAPQVTPTLSDKENSTKYFDFPPHDDKSKASNSTASLDEEELNRRLLEIDMSLAEKLKKFRQEQDGTGEPQPTVLAPEDQINDPDQPFLDRLHRLIQESHQQENAVEAEKPPAVQPFVPFLVDIPKLPILEPEPDRINLGPERRHPPPSKGLLTAKKFNGNISLMPHELSTITEADSQHSAKISPNQSKTNASIDRELHQLLDQAGSPDSESTLPAAKPNSPGAASGKHKSASDKSDASISNALTCSDSTCTNLAALSSSSSKMSSSSSSGDLKSIEAMLKSIGLDWAIPTLHKTQEALALTSSSSSVDLSSKKTSARKSTSESEVSLKEFLKKQLLEKVSSSSLNRSNASPASFVRDCSDVSSIHEKTKRRTSTPVFSSKSTNKSKEEQLFSGASDISSVRHSSANVSEKRTFQSLAGDDQSLASESTAD